MRELLKNFLCTWLLGFILVVIVYYIVYGKIADASTLITPTITAGYVDLTTGGSNCGGAGYPEYYQVYRGLPFDTSASSTAYAFYNNPQCSGSFTIDNDFDGYGASYYWLYNARQDVFMSWYFNGTTGGLDVSTRFISLDISTTTSMVNITGYWNATTTPNITEQLDFYQYSTMLGKESYLSITATSTGYFDVNLPYKPLPTPYTGATTTTTITADLYFYANLSEIDSSYYNPFGEYDTRYSTLLDATSTILTASTTNLWNIDTDDLFLYPEYLCDITSLTGCFKNALIWAFYPTKKAVENFYDLQTLVQSKAPFGYFSVVKTNIEGLSATSTPSFTLVIPASLKTYIFNPFDIGLSSILWIYFIFNLYKRLKHITI